MQRKKGSKYNSKKIEWEEKTFDSKKELARYQQLRHLENQGKIKNLQTQVKYVLIPAQREESTQVYSKGPRKGCSILGKVIERECAYYADFVYFDLAKMETVVEDVKGYRGNTGAYNVFSIKRKLMLEKYGIRVVEV